MCVCSLSYPSGKAYAPYCIVICGLPRSAIFPTVACPALPYFQLWPAPHYHIFPRFLINGKIFEEKLLNIKCGFGFSAQLLSKAFLFIRRIQRDIIINVLRHPVNNPLFLSGYYWILEFSRQIFEKKNTNTKFHQNLSSGNRTVPCERTGGRMDTERHDEANIRLSKFCERVWKHVTLAHTNQHSTTRRQHHRYIKLTFGLL
jgi:hypothetical protein